MSRHNIHAVEYAYSPGNGARYAHIVVFRRSWPDRPGHTNHAQRRYFPTANGVARLFRVLAARGGDDE